MTIRGLTTASTATLLAALLAFGPGCKGPLERSQEEEQREILLNMSNRYRATAGDAGIKELTRAPSLVERKYKPEQIEYADKNSGPAAYANDPLDLGTDLTGKRDIDVVMLSLQKAVELTAKNNLDVRYAMYGPAVAETQLTQAYAVFDAVYFADFTFQNLDTPRPLVNPAFGGGVNALGGNQQTEQNGLSTGIRKTLITGGQLTVQTDWHNNFQDPTLSFYKKYYDADVLIQIQQPLLRNFGTDITRAQINLSANARLESIQDVRKAMIQALADTEEAYWQLYFARNDLLIRERLLARSLSALHILESRAIVDAPQVSITQTEASVERNRADVIRARQTVRTASDRLKRLMHSDEIPMTSESVILPLESPADLPIQFNLLDAVTTALRKRPELQRALYEINDTSIRLRVADNQLLPKLDLSGTLRYNGVSPGTLHGAYDEVVEGRFIDYLAGLQFEVPIGNRGAEAQYAEADIRRKAAVTNYQKAAQDAILDVKNTLRDVLTTYEEISANRGYRRAAMENLHNIEVQENLVASITPEFVNLKLQSQERLADAERQEAQSLAAYQIAISKFYQALGTLIEKDGVQFDVEAPPQGYKK